MHHGEKRKLPFAVHKLISNAERDEYRYHLENLLQERPYNPDLPPEGNWNIVKSCIVSAAEETVGRGKRKQPEWFEENVDELMSLINLKNKAQN